MSYVKSALKTCTACKGNGHRKVRKWENKRWIFVDKPCLRCHGTGRVKKLGTK